MKTKKKMRIGIGMILQTSSRSRTRMEMRTWWTMRGMMMLVRFVRGQAGPVSPTCY